MVSVTVCVQVEATYYGTPRVEAFQMEGSLSGVDLLPLMQPPPGATPATTSTAAAAVASSGLYGAEAPPALVDGSRVRLRVTGGLRLSAVRDENTAARRQAGLTGEDGYLFTGECNMRWQGAGRGALQSEAGAEN